MNDNGAAHKNWPSVPLGELLAEAQPGFACGERDKNGVIQLRMNNVDTQGRFVWSEVLRVPADKATIDEYQLLPLDVMFNNTNSTELVGKSALFRDYVEPVVYSNHFTRLRVRSAQLNPSYLAAWLNHEWRRGTFAEICNRWIGQSAVKAGKLLALEIPLPPLAEQERIAARLTEQLAAVASARAAAQARLAAAEALPAAYLREVFEGPEVNQWQTLQMRESCELLPSKSISTTGDAVVRAITTACLSETGFLPGGIKTARMRADDVPECVVRFGEILVARSNTPELVGRAALYNGEPAGIVATDLTIRVWPFRHIDPSFLAAFLSYLFQTGYWKERAGGASGTMKKITREQLLDLEFRVPPGNEMDSIEEQRRITAALALRLAEVERLTAILRDELAAIDALPAALLRGAFNGQA